MFKRAKIHVNANDINSRLPIKASDFTTFNALTEGVVLLWDNVNKYLKTGVGSGINWTTAANKVNYRTNLFLSLGNYDEAQGNGVVGALPLAQGIVWYGELLIQATRTALLANLAANQVFLTIEDGKIITTATADDICFARMANVLAEETAPTSDDLTTDATHCWVEVESVVPFAYPS